MLDWPLRTDAGPWIEMPGQPKPGTMQTDPDRFPGEPHNGSDLLAGALVPVIQNEDHSVLVAQTQQGSLDLLLLLPLLNDRLRMLLRGSDHLPPGSLQRD